MNQKLKTLLHYGLRLALLLPLVFLAGCIFESNDEDAVSQPLEVGGAGVKGPLAGAEVNLYLADLGQSDLKGELQGTGSTGEDASIQDLEVPGDISGLVLLEFVVDDDTTDMTTGAAPIFDSLITLVDAQRLVEGDDIYASVLTTMVVNLAALKADDGTPYSGNEDGSISEEEMLAALDVAQNQVKSTLGFGLEADTDIFTTPPLLTDDTTDAAVQQSVAAYRQAIEAVAAVANEIAEAGGGSSAQEAFEALTQDLSDGAIDGQSDEGAITALETVTTLADIVTQDVTDLVIPGTDTTVGDIETVLAEETEDTGATSELDETVSVDPEPATVEVDSDADGVVDSEDAFPDDPEEAVDTDEDGVGDNGDAFPEDATETTDTDGDGLGDNSDPFPVVSADDDEDNDGVPDDTDNCVSVYNPDQANADGDEAGDACDGLSSAIWNEFNWDEAAWQQ